MPDKIIIGWASLATLLTAILGVFARVTFVRKSQLFAKDGKPLYRHVGDCVLMQEKCMSQTCAKMDMLRDGQQEVRSELKSLDDRMHHQSEIIIRIETLVETIYERRKEER